MKKTLGIIIGVAIIILLALLIRNETYQPKTVATNTITKIVENQAPLEASSAMDGMYTVNSNESVINWTGRTLVKSHLGTIGVAEGTIGVASTDITGAFTIDMSTITSDSSGLDDHLKSEDFFDVNQYPQAFVTLKSYSAGNITMDVTIKDITNEVTAPATIAVQGDVLALTSNLTIDRTDWDIVYNSGSVISDLGDRAINDLIELQVEIKSTK